MNSKTESDSNYANSYSESISPFLSSSKPSSKIERGRETKNGNKNSKNNHKIPSVFSAELMERDIISEIEEVERVIDEAYKLLPPPRFKTQIIDIEDLRAMQESIRSKNLQIKGIEEQVKLLKSGVFFENKKTIDTFPKLSNQIKMVKQSLMKSHKQLINKKKQAQQKHQSIRTIEERFRQKCISEGIEYLTFEQFKQLQMKKKKQTKRFDKLKKIGSGKKLSNYPQFSTMKEIPEKDHRGDYRNPENHVTPAIQNDSKKMRDLLQKKNVAQAALKNAKKRHFLEINDLNGKQEFLKDECQELDEKIAVKQHELRLAKSKFSASRSSSQKNEFHKRYKTERNI